jgi:predicted ester cyclase
MGKRRENMHTNRRQVLAALALVPGMALAASSLADSGSDQEHDAVEQTDHAAKNAAIIRRQNAVGNSGDYSASVGFNAKDADNFGRPLGPKGILPVLTDIHTTFPDWRMEIEDLAAVGDVVITRMTVTGTHKGVAKLHVNGGLLVGVPPTGKSFKVEHIHWCRYKDGLIVDHYAVRDDLGMMQQLGLLPPVKPYAPPT